MVQTYFSARRPQMAAFLPEHFERTLEVGCGDGNFSQHFLASARECWGIEPNRAAAEQARAKLARIFVGTFEQFRAELPHDHFDLVVCNDVIEHMPSHDDFLEQIRINLTRDGLIVGSVPNVRHITLLVKLLLLKDWPYADDGILDRTHLRFFTEKSLRQIFVQNGFIVEKLQGIRSIIKDGVTGLPYGKNLIIRLATLALVGLSLGYWRDIQYPQIAFRIRVAPLPTPV
jgi:2-polyprenyl-3-methyl-5-hydroxy-6-metoxy-1,4-benzoquinol methylase